MAKKLRRAVKAWATWSVWYQTWDAEGGTHSATRCERSGWSRCYIVPAAEYERMTHTLEATRAARRKPKKVTPCVGIYADSADDGCCRYCGIGVESGEVRQCQSRLSPQEARAQTKSTKRRGK